MGKPLAVEIIAYAPTAFYHCLHCEVAWREMGATNRLHDEQVATSLPPDLLDDYQRLSDWVRQLSTRYPDQIQFNIIDAASPEGVIKSLRHHLRRYPGIIFGGRTYAGTQAWSAAGTAIERMLGKPAWPPAGPERR